jgi:hypothetical protein
MRRQFLLPEADEDYLNACGLEWETIIESSWRWLLLHGYPLPHGYNVSKATAAVSISAGYPDAQLDMVYFHPPLTRLDGGAIGALSSQTIDGKSFQRWSRHRTGANPWRPGEDDLSSHLALVRHWLEREFEKG